MDESVKEMLKRMEEGGNPLREKVELYYQKKSKLLKNTAELKRMYDDLTATFSDASLLSEIQIGGNPESVPEHASPLWSPMPKPGEQRADHLLDCYSDSGVGAGSSESSSKEGIEYLSISSLRSQPDSFNCSPSLNGDGELLLGGQLVLGEGSENFIRNLKRSWDYNELSGSVSENEEKLKLSNLKRKTTEDEIVNLKGNLKESNQNDSDSQGRQITALQKKVAELENRIFESQNEKWDLIGELEISKAKLLDSEKRLVKLKQDCTDEICVGAHRLRCQLDLAWTNVDAFEAEVSAEKRLASELQARLADSTADLSRRDDEIRELNAEFREAREGFHAEKAKLESAISELSAKLETAERAVESLKYRIPSGDREAELRSQIKRLEAEQAEREEVVKLLSDRLVAEKEGFVAQVLRLTNELDSRESHIQWLEEQASSGDAQVLQLEKEMSQVRIECEKADAECERSKRVAEELGCRVEALGAEVERQRAAIAEGEEEKREVIRQLCFSLEYHRGECQELRRAWLRKQPHLVRC